ncbi:hypothetical protein G7Y89_g1932 [Cudoniella acicularis]|uniref:Protein argonaute N-terminal domain-containing protein n=1 Tax=Cudoniella acicularis TaxID=354080 RepID=A0A8H4RUA9_9HELO|nr:hypothetical protein G7Y89_g1932 [Cudoniella acicularis]
MEIQNYRTFDKVTNEAVHQFPSNLPLRPGFNTVGKAIAIRVNQYKLTNFPDNDIYQYDINIGNGAEKAGKIMAVWKSKTLQDAIKKASGGAPVLWDGNKLAWRVTFPEIIQYPPTNNL